MQELKTFTQWLRVVEDRYNSIEHSCFNQCLLYLNERYGK